MSLENKGSYTPKHSQEEIRRLRALRTELQNELQRRHTNLIQWSDNEVTRIKFNYLAEIENAEGADKKIKLEGDFANALSVQQEDFEKLLRSLHDEYDGQIRDLEFEIRLDTEASQISDDGINELFK